MRPAASLLLLAGCVVTTYPGFEPPDAPGSDTDPAADTDTTGGTDAPDTGVDTDSTPDTDRAPDVVCYLGPSRDRSTCLPVVPRGAWGSDWDWPASGDPRYLSPTHFLDLDTIAANTRLAPNFALSELAEAYKGQWAVVQPGLIDHLQSVRDRLGGPLTVTSGFRSPGWNAGVGGVLLSRHLYGDGVDLDTAVTNLDGLADACADEGADYIGYYADHIHCDWRGDALEPAFYGAPGPVEVSLQPRPVFQADLIRGVAWTTTAYGWDEGPPLREWTALDAQGRVLVRATGDHFTPPAGAVRVSVVVGREVTVTVAP